jgi:hypothetical protein
MTATARGRVAIAALIAVLAFGAAFAVHKATAGTAHAPPPPVPVVLSATPVQVSGLALPAAAPALRRPPHPTAPAQSATPSPTQTPATPATPAPAAPSTPAAPPSSGGGKGSGPVLVG